MDRAERLIEALADKQNRLDDVVTLLTDAQIRTEERFRETDLRFREVAERFRDTDGSIRELRTSIGELREFFREAEERSRTEAKAQRERLERWMAEERAK